MPFLQTTRIQYILWGALSAFAILASFQSKPVERLAIHQILRARTDSLVRSLGQLKDCITRQASQDTCNREVIVRSIHASRVLLKRVDFWLRYADPIHYRWIHGPLPVEWETEVFEKHEAPYLRRAGGLMLIENELQEEDLRIDSMKAWCDMALAGVAAMEMELKNVDYTNPDWFLFANRHFLLNLSTVYTTGYECPAEDRRIPELQDMCSSLQEVYAIFSRANPDIPMDAFNALYERMLHFLSQEPKVYSEFRHYHFIRDYAAPLYALNAGIIQSTRAHSTNLSDYSLNNNALSIFDPALYQAQNRKGIFAGMEDSSTLHLLRELGSKLFYDPLLSGNMQRSCASCHKPEHLFSDTQRFASTFDRSGSLNRNAPSLFQAASNHLLMHDGAHFSLQEQARQVIHHVKEMAGDEATILKRMGQIPEYRDRLNALARSTPLAPTYTFDHVLSALTYYYTSYGDSIPVFFRNMQQANKEEELAVMGFNLFMGKAACATCHFLPRFNGVKPPFTGSEFEVIGTPADRNGTQLSSDSGRYLKHSAPEMLYAFRTPGLWNIAHTFPYMHNGVFRSLEEVIDFSDAGGGLGKGLKLSNQTLPADSLKLGPLEKKALIRFLTRLNTEEPGPVQAALLPKGNNPRWSARKPGGLY